MKDVEGTVAKIVALQRRHAVPIRGTSALAADPSDAVGIATIRVVTEDQVQAIAFGPLARRPTTIVRLNPLGRDTSDLESFADWLVNHVRRVIGAGRPLRVWVPHGKTIETLEILGRRYESNRHASPMLQEAARYCRIIAEETRYAGQQTVAIALDILLAHVVTGQMPIEDQHLGAVLAWIRPEPGRDPREVAFERARWPASGILINTPDRRDDDRIELLRKELKGAAGRRRNDIEREIRAILAAAVNREWELLVAARRAYWDLDLAPSVLDELLRASHERVSWAVNNHLVSPRRAVAITRKLEEYENALQRAEDAALRSDIILRRRAARLGHVIDGVVERVDQPQRNRHPCHLILRTTQNNLRVRSDDRVALVGGSIAGVVRQIRPSRDGTTLIRIELKKGVRGAGALAGNRQEWIENRDFPSFMRHQALSEADSRGIWMVDGSLPPPARPSRMRNGDPLQLAHVARRRQ
jgi:hypothetical protein